MYHTLSLLYLFKHDSVCVCYFLAALSGHFLFRFLYWMTEIRLHVYQYLTRMPKLTLQLARNAGVDLRAKQSLCSVLIICAAGCAVLPLVCDVHSA